METGINTTKEMSEFVVQPGFEPGFPDYRSRLPPSITDKKLIPLWDLFKSSGTAEGWGGGTIPGQRYWKIKRNQLIRYLCKGSNMSIGFIYG